MIIVSEFTSGNIARVQRHAAVARRCRLCAVGAAFGSPPIILPVPRSKSNDR